MSRLRRLTTPSSLRRVGAWMLVWSIATASLIEAWQVNVLAALFVVGLGFGMGGDS